MNYKVNITNLFTFSCDVDNLIADFPHTMSEEGFFLEVDDEKFAEKLAEQNEKIQKLFFE